jgi:hypothetical protein
VNVVEYEFDDDVFGCVDHDTHTIYLDSRLTHGEQRATLAHELGHLEQDVHVSGLWLPASEWKVDRWAAERLVPIEDLVRAIMWSQRLPEIAEELRVDEPTLRSRLRCLTNDEQDALLALGVRFRAP